MSTVTKRLTLPEAPACPPWCTAVHEDGGWEVAVDDSGRVQAVGKSCGNVLGVLQALERGEVEVTIERIATYEECKLDVGEPSVYLNGTYLTAGQAEAVARRLHEAADLIRGSGGGGPACLTSAHTSSTLDA